MFNIGTQELLIILFVVLLLFGAKRIPEVARSLGKGVGDFRDALSGVERELKREAKLAPREVDGIVPSAPAAGPAPAGAGPGETPAPPPRPPQPPRPLQPDQPDQPDQQPQPDQPNTPSPPDAGAGLAG